MEVVVRSVTNVFASSDRSFQVKKMKKNQIYFFLAQIRERKVAYIYQYF